MQQHPFIISTFYKTVGIAVVVLAAAVFALLLVLYGNATVFLALTDGLVYVCAMAACAYVYWYAAPFLQVFQAKIAVALFVQAVCLGMTFLLLSGFESIELFTGRIFLHLVYGFLCWIIVMQWYSGFQEKTQSVEKEEKTMPVEVKKDVIDRISVKDGSEIHIVPVEDLLYIQAYGDYVMLFTNTGKHLKEQTMKYFELHLPSSFVRIHRSHIVNANQIIRIELFGKENYNVRLKNGVCLRASSAGYKLLKERLSL